MTEQEKIRRALAPLHASADAVTEVLYMAEKEKRYPMRGTMRRMSSLAAAAVLLLMIGATAFAAGLAVHAERQQRLREELRIDKSETESYLEYALPEEDAGQGLVLLSTINDGQAQKVYFNVSPVTEEQLARFPQEISFAWTLDGYEYWGSAMPQMPEGAEISGEENVRRAVEEYAYDAGTQTLSLMCYVFDEAFAQAQATSGTDTVAFRAVLWDHTAQAAAGKGVEEWLQSLEPYGTVTLRKTAEEMRVFDLGRAVYHSEETDRTLTLVSLDLTPTSAVWHFDYENAAKIHASADEEELLLYGRAEDEVCLGAEIVFADGTSFSTGGVLSEPYEGGTVNCYCGWSRAIDLDSVAQIRLGDAVLWEK